MNTALPLDEPTERRRFFRRSYRRTLTVIPAHPVTPSESEETPVPTQLTFMQTGVRLWDERHSLERRHPTKQVGSRPSRLGRIGLFITTILTGVTGLSVWRTYDRITLQNIAHAQFVALPMTYPLYQWVGFHRVSPLVDPDKS